MARRRKPLVTVRVAGRDDEERTMQLTKAQAFRAIQIELDAQEAEEARAAGRQPSDLPQTWKDAQLGWIIPNFADFDHWLLRPESVRQALAEVER